MKKNEIRLYNILLPLWLLMFMPPALLVTIPVNFAVDSAVLFLASHFVCRKMGKMLWKKSILKVFLLGFLADLIPAAILFALLFLLEGTPAEAFYSAAVTNPLSGVGSALIIFCAVLTASALIYVFDRFIAFKNTGLEKSQVHRLALFMAVLTAPWSFFIPAY